ncbi:hypothetical protein QE152_g35316 [Popillia japonica]|uniref:Protein quiver n=1 Tax=Popillia japonica TaxID=7064 RepID=A0AAW1IG95_POPJA
MLLIRLIIVSLLVLRTTDALTCYVCNSLKLVSCGKPKKQVCDKATANPLGTTPNRCSTITGINELIDKPFEIRTCSGPVLSHKVCEAYAKMLANCKNLTDIKCLACAENLCNSPSNNKEGSAIMISAFLIVYFYILKSDALKGT